MTGGRRNLQTSLAKLKYLASLWDLDDGESISPRLKIHRKRFKYV
jgi:hypothetical protein